MKDQIKTRWDARARKNAPFFICNDERSLSPEVFRASGATDTRVLFVEPLASIVDLPSARCLEIGCGTGRMTESIAEHVEQIVGMDASGEMVERARRDSTHHNVSYEVGNGVDLEEFGTETFDVVFSYLVFQHFPSRELQVQMLKEVDRVLKPGGVARIHFRGQHKSMTKRLARLLLPLLWRVPSRIAGLPAWDPPFLDPTWVGHIVSEQELERWSAGLGHSYERAKVPRPGGLDYWVTLLPRR